MTNTTTISVDRSTLPLLGLAIVVCCFFFQATPVLGQDPNVDLLIAQGWKLLETGAVTDMEQHFRKALAMAPRHPEAHAGLGIALLRQGRIKSSLESLLAAHLLKSKYRNLDLEIGRVCYLIKAYRKGVLHLEQFIKANPNAWEGYEVLGLCHFELHNYEQCISMLTNEVLQREGKHADMYDYYLTLSHYGLGNRDEAIFRYRLSKDRSPDSPYLKGLNPEVLEGSMAEAVTDVWSEFRRQQAQAKWWWFTAGIEYTYDTNPLSLGSGIVLPSAIADINTDTAQLNLGTGAYIIQKEDFLWTASLNARQKWYHNLATFDQDAISMSTFAEWWPNDRFGITGSAAVSNLEVGSEKILDRWRVGSGFYLVEKNWTRSHIYYTFENNEYFYDNLSSSQDMDSIVNTVGITQDAYIPGTDLHLTFNYSHAWHVASGSDYDANFDSVSLSMGHPLFWKIYGTATVAHTWGHYDEFNSRSIPANSRRRDDDIFTMSMKLERRITETITAHFGMTAVEGRSNLAVFDYDRMIWSSGITLRF